MENKTDDWLVNFSQWKPWQKGILAAGVILVIVAVVFKLKGNDDDYKPVYFTSEQPVSTASNAETAWTEVLTFKGNGRKKSKSFHLFGGEAKLVYTYRSAGGGVGVFGVYLADKGVDIMRDGGVPEVMSSELRVSDESEIQKPEGDYYLDVNAYGNWTVKVMEKR